MLLLVDSPAEPVKDAVGDVESDMQFWSSKRGTLLDLAIAHSLKLTRW